MKLEKEKYVYESTFNWRFTAYYLFPLAIVILSLYYTWPQITIHEFKEGLLIYLLICTFLAGASLYALLTLKRIKLSKEYLTLIYPLLQKKVKIPWSEITSVNMQMATTKTSPGDYIFSTGRNIKTDNKTYRILSFNYTNFPLFLRNLDKRLNSKIKKNMKLAYTKERSDFWKSEKSYRRFIARYVVPVGIIVLIIIFIFLK
jgi:hypothetical protein